MVALTAADEPDNRPTPTRIVGSGASAGGLAALEQFFEQVPLRSGLAYIVVQHLDPTQKALLAELLQRVTPMRVCEAVQLLRVAPDCVYVIPPNSDLSVIDGVINLQKPAEQRGLRPARSGHRCGAVGDGVGWHAGAAGDQDFGRPDPGSTTRNGPV